MKLQFLRLLLGENGQFLWRKNEASSLDDALKQLNLIWSTEDNIYAACKYPQLETD